jgi:hypothetical protein
VNEAATYRTPRYRGSFRPALRPDAARPRSFGENYHEKKSAGPVEVAAAAGKSEWPSRMIGKSVGDQARAVCGSDMICDRAPQSK